jgi:signal transduction histidine kinase/CheY-like chemotaxis protein
MADHVSLFNEKTGAPTGEHRMVGVLHQFYYWRDLLSGILLKGNEGLVCVIENPCNQTFTYEWKGQDVIYLGRGDLHDPKYERMHQSMKFEDFASQSSTGRQYTGSPLGGGACPYTLHIYSGSKREAEFITNQPKIFTVAVVLIFAFTSAMFILYDQCVERRQRKIMYTAARSNANVALLEQMVRERTKKLQETNRCLEEANRRVVRASAAQLEHFACMSHEIRTPLNCIIGLSSLLLDTELQPMQEESMRMIVTSGDLLLTVVNDVLDYSKLESGNVEINVIRSNLQETLNNIVQSMETRGQPKKLAIRTKYDPAISEYVYMDYRRVQQILFNLLSNAIKFSFEGGVIELSAVLARESDSNALTSAAADDKNPQESSPNEGNILRFIVKDYGRGIEKKDFETIFQPFRQASAETERVYGGTGLGLAVTSRLIKSLGGRINVDSQEGEWSQFTVDLPFQDAPVDVSLLSNRLENTTVLLFDDDSENVAAMTQVFRRCSLSFFIFTSMSEMEKLLTGAGSLSPSRRYICLVQENLYDAAAVRQLEMHAPYVLLSHGPKYTVKDSKGHYRSLTNVLPSILLESFAASMDQVSTIVRRPSAELRVRHSAKLPSGGGNVGDLRILIAEDNKINQKVLLRILKRLHYENVDVVDDGKQACDKELEKEYDVILMDIQMPVMNGIEACRIIMGRGSGDGVEDHKEEADSRPKPRIIFVTAHVADVFEAECREAGGVDFLPKPFNIGDIENCLQRNAQAPVLSSSFVDA